MWQLRDTAKVRPEVGYPYLLCYGCEKKIVYHTLYLNYIAGPTAGYICLEAYTFPGLILPGMIDSMKAAGNDWKFSLTDGTK